MSFRREPLGFPLQLCVSCVLTGPGPPTQFSDQVISDEAVLLSWGDPVNSNGIIRKYHIKTYDTKTGRQVNSHEIDAGKKRKLISSLKPFTNYIFTIQAVTIKAGEMANLTARTHQGGNRHFCDVFVVVVVLSLGVSEFP